ncbi:glycosyltransferase family 39 protein [Companilactobacillus zhongbaensis]|uniref:glycosyltransferase family 39 protein n=1 Tax=Companilactobacillus zhongbaensis TaxID=2486009 RepID=UPI000F78FBC5|nr:glycosyltransferase family 39 protein [Companilactobacillus zhongbaensis]
MNRSKSYQNNINKPKHYRFIGHTRKNRLVSPGFPLGRTIHDLFGSVTNHKKTAPQPQIKQKSSSIVQTIKFVFQAVSVSIAAVLSLLMAVATWNSSNNLTTDPWMITSFVLICGLIFSAIYLISIWLRDKPLFIFYLIILVISLIKIVFVMFYAIHPTSDYFNYHYFAFQHASGVLWTKNMVGTNLFFPHVLNIAMMFSIPYSLIGTNYATAQLFNVFLTFFDAAFIYILGKRFFNKQAGIIASLIFSLIPAYYLYSTLNGAEPFFLTVVLALMICFDTFMNRPQDSTTDQWVASFRNMSLLAIIAYMIRPTIGIWIIMGIIYLILVRYPYKLTTKFKLTRSAYFLGITVLFMLFAGLSTTIYSHLYQLPIASGSINTRYSLATGTTERTGGSYNYKLYDQLTKDIKNGKSTKQINQTANEQMNNQFRQNVKTISNGPGWLNLLSRKYANFADESYGYGWIYYNTYSKNRYLEQYSDLRYPLISFSTIFFEFMLVLASLSMLLIFIFERKNSEPLISTNKIFYLSLMLNGFILGSMLFEVQGRYHVVLYIPLALAAGAITTFISKKRALSAN